MRIKGQFPKPKSDPKSACTDYTRVRNLGTEAKRQADVIKSIDWQEHRDTLRDLRKADRVRQAKLADVDWDRVKELLDVHGLTLSEAIGQAIAEEYHG